MNRLSESRWPVARTFAAALVILITPVFLTACGGDGGTDPGTDGDGNVDPPARTIKENPSFAADVQEIFDRTGCSSSSCHGAGQAAGLDLRAANSYADLVNVGATNEPLIRVIPNDAQNSYLVIKIEGRQSVGSRMPIGGGALDNVDVANIRNWINTGALNN